jgi:hypothetical protein
MKSYIVITHTDTGAGRKPLQAFAVIGADHHEAVSRVRHGGAPGEIDVDAVLHLSDETAARLELGADEIWPL